MQGSQETSVHDQRDDEDLDHNRHRDDHVRNAQTIVLDLHVPNLARRVHASAATTDRQGVGTS
eukprot:COSAG02_NODE_4497_length_5292_cov_2.165993_1_plen_62_part_10